MGAAERKNASVSNQIKMLKASERPSRDSFSTVCIKGFAVDLHGVGADQ